MRKIWQGISRRRPFLGQPPTAGAPATCPSPGIKVRYGTRRFIAGAVLVTVLPHAVTAAPVNNRPKPIQVIKSSNRVASRVVYRTGTITHVTPAPPPAPVFDYPVTVLTDGANTLWKCRENTGNLSDSGPAGITAIANGGPTYAQIGPLSNGSNGILLDGVDDYFTAGDVYDFSGTTAFSFECWIKLAANHATAFSRIASKEETDGSGKQGWNIGVDPTDQPLPRCIFFERWLDGTSQSLRTATQLVIGAWTHLKCTFSGTQLRVYINGVEDANSPVASTFSVVNHTIPLHIGRRSNTSTAFINATFSHIAIYSGTVLTDTQITAHYVARLFVNRPGTKGIRTSYGFRPRIRGSAERTTIKRSTALVSTNRGKGLKVLQLDRKTQQIHRGRGRIIRISPPKQQGIVSYPACSWADHFLSNSWLSPKNQVDASYPIYIQPAAITGAYEEVIDYGVVISNIIAIITYTERLITPLSDVSVIVKMATSLDGAAYSAFTAGSAQFFPTFRYLKFRLEFTGVDDKALKEIYNVQIDISVKRENDGGEVLSLLSDVGGTEVFFNKDFKDIESLTATIKSTTEPYIAIILFVDIPDPDSFHVMAFDTTGNRVTKVVEWKARGIV